MDVNSTHAATLLAIVSINPCVGDVLQIGDDESTRREVRKVISHLSYVQLHWTDGTNGYSSACHDFEGYCTRPGMRVVKLAPRNLIREAKKDDES